MDISQIFSDLSSTTNIVPTTQQQVSNNLLIDIRPPEEKKTMALGDYLEYMNKHSTTTNKNASICSGSPSLISKALGI